MNLQHFLTQNIAPILSARDSFFSTEQFPLDDEEIADIAINSMLLVMNNCTRPIGNTEGLILDYAPLVGYGVRFAWKDRITFSRYVDTLNDEVPEFAAVGLTGNRKEAYASAITICNVRDHKIPKRVHLALRGANSIYRTAYLKGYSGLSRTSAKRSRGELETLVQGGFAGLMPDGHVIGVDHHGAMGTWHGELFAYVVGVHNDRKYFWEVTASEEFWDSHPAVVKFSIDEEYIKSLFYARSFPMTGTGRLRPILHWVSAHKRRMKEGIDIDVRKHLRGIDAFAMHGVNFQISEPKKPIKA